MSRNTITLLAPNGARVRTVNSRRYFVVDYGSITSKYDHATGTYQCLDAPMLVATVVKRTDSAVAALAAHRKLDSAVVFEVLGNEPKQLDARALQWQADAEKAAKQAGLPRTQAKVEITPALVGKRVRVTYTQRYTTGRSETRVETGRLLRLTPAGGIEISIPSLSLPGFGACPTSSLISADAIIKLERVQ